MSSIAAGIEVIYKSNKSEANEVCFQYHEDREYSNGGLLLGMMQVKTIELLSYDIKDAIIGFPDALLPATIENITNCFKWLCWKAEDEDFPVASELFRSNFNIAIQEAVKETPVTTLFTTQDFFSHCYQNYLQDLRSFYTIAGSLIDFSSGIADEYERFRVIKFSASVNETYNACTKKLTIYRGKQHKTIYKSTIVTFDELLACEYHQLKSSGQVIKRCANCGQVFIPESRKDAIYCNSPAPSDPTKTCREVGPGIRRNENRKQDETWLQIYKKQCANANWLRRNPQYDHKTKRQEHDDLLTAYKEYMKSKGELADGREQNEGTGE